MADDPKSPQPPEDAAETEGAPKPKTEPPSEPKTPAGEPKTEPPSEPKTPAGEPKTEPPSEPKTPAGELEPEPPSEPKTPAGEPVPEPEPQPFAEPAPEPEAAEPPEEDTDSAEIPPTGEVGPEDLAPGSESVSVLSPAPPPPSLEVQSALALSDDDAKFRGPYNEVDDDGVPPAPDPEPESGEATKAENVLPESEDIPENVDQLREIMEGSVEDTIGEAVKRSNELIDTAKESKTATTEINGIMEKVDSASQTVERTGAPSAATLPTVPSISVRILQKPQIKCETREPPTDHDLIMDTLTGRDIYPCNECETNENERCSSDDIFDFISDVIIGIIEFSVSKIETLATKLMESSTSSGGGTGTSTSGENENGMPPILASIISLSKSNPPPPPPLPSAHSVVDEIRFEDLADADGEPGEVTVTLDETPIIDPNGPDPSNPEAE